MRLPTFAHVPLTEPVKACQSHSFRWRLGDRLLGVGTYRVAATVSDADFQYSKTVSRKSVTTD